MLKAAGNLDKIKASYLTFADAGRALANGKVDAICQSSAPAAAVKELAETKGAFVIPFSAVHPIVSDMAYFLNLSPIPGIVT